MFYKPAVSQIVLTVLVVLLIVCCDPVFGQISTAVPFLLISPSPEANGQGCSSISRITDDPYAINTNPAHLGLSGFQNNVMLSFYPTKTLWLSGLEIGDITYNSWVLSGGLNLQDYLNLPISVGAAFSRVYLDYGTFTYTREDATPIGTFNAEEHNDAISIGVGLDYGVRVAMGITFRNTESMLYAGSNLGEQGSGRASAWTHDLGLLVDIPVVQLIAKESELMSGITPVLNVSFGTALTNVGEKMVYIDEAHAEPFPRTVSVGTTVEIGCNYRKTNHKLFSFTYSREASNLLVGRTQNGTSYYRDLFGDIDFFNNIVQGNRTATIDLAQGWQAGLAEFIFVRGGWFDGTGERSLTTSGFGFRIAGFFKLLKTFGLPQDETMSYIADHFDLRYNQSTYHSSQRYSPLDETEFSSLTIVVKP
jgi:hypothetical protein